MTQIKQVKLGNQGLVISAIGLGCMGLTGSESQFVYGKANEKDGLAVIERAIELGCNFLDTADIYGPFNNERLIAKAIKGKRDQVIIATKFGFELGEDGKFTGVFSGKKDYVKRAAERSLKNLNTDYIDLYYLHRLDTSTPIEETITAMGELVKEGKVRYIGLSEVSASTIRKAHAVHPLTALQTEYSLFERSLDEDGTTDTLKELEISLVAYSPLGRGFLSGELKRPEDLDENDARKMLPRFQGENFYKNLELVKELQAIAAQKQVSSSQLALAWVIAKGHVPIPGTRRVKYAEENIAATQIDISLEEIARLEAILPLSNQQPTSQVEPKLNKLAGERYDDFMIKTIDRS